MRYQAQRYCTRSLTRKVQRVPLESLPRLTLSPGALAVLHRMALGSGTLGILHLLILARLLRAVLFAAGVKLCVCIPIPGWINRPYR